MVRELIWCTQQLERGYVFVRPEARHLFLTTDACVTQKTQQKDLTTLLALGQCEASLVCDYSAVH